MTAVLVRRRSIPMQAKDIDTPLEWDANISAPFAAGRHPLTGTGILAGQFPDGLTTIEGEPTTATVRVLYRPESGAPGDGVVVAEVQSNQDGTWLVEGLNPELKFDVVGRLKDFNDVIMANVSPVVADEIRWVGKLEWDADLGKVVGMLRFTGGVGPYSVTSVSGLPAGLTPELMGNELTIVGEPTEWGEFTGVIGVKDSGSLTADVVVRLEVERPLPTVIGEPFGGGFYAGDIQYPDGQWYKLIVAGKVGDYPATVWKTSNTLTPGADDLFDGAANTLAMAAAGLSAHPAAQHCVMYTGGGNNDWYLPSKNEINVLYLNLGAARPNTPPTFKSRGAEAFENSGYWASTQVNASSAWIQQLHSGSVFDFFNKAGGGGRVRPIRRIPFTP